MSSDTVMIVVLMNISADAMNVMNAPRCATVRMKFARVAICVRNASVPICWLAEIVRIVADIHASARPATNARRAVIARANFARTAKIAISILIPARWTAGTVWVAANTCVNVQIVKIQLSTPAVARMNVVRTANVV